MKLIHRKQKRLSSVIKPYILASIAAKNLLDKKLRTLLTMMGIVIGVGAVVFLISLALGLHQVVNKEVLGTKSVNTIDVTSPNLTNILLSDANVNKINQFAHVNSVSATYILPGQINYQGSVADTVVYGTTNQYISLSALTFVAGSKTLKTSSDAIVDTAFLDLIGQSNARSAIGKKVEIKTSITDSSGKVKLVKSNLTIRGVINIGSGAEIYMNDQPFINAGDPTFSQLKVVADNRADVAVIRQQITGLGLSTASPLDTLGQINTIFTIFTFVVAGFGGIGMVIAVLGMFNTLTISLLERTSEIGLMITMGARKADIARLMIFEALLLSVFGGIGGIILAWIVGEIINIALTAYAHTNGVTGTIHAFSVTPLLVLASIGLTIVAGLLVAYYPSRRATRINPIDALRFE
ncbi:MAG TPA: FtsX-like permease family protein [Candidatus Saccharimonadales bacterium]|nr:FtsX-like permease family protein [Candidatus Saccharimonadales bacterium]